MLIAWKQVMPSQRDHSPYPFSGRPNGGGASPKGGGYRPERTRADSPQVDCPFGHAIGFAMATVDDDGLHGEPKAGHLPSRQVPYADPCFRPAEIVGP
mgnify:CR=1 FL=1